MASRIVTCPECDSHKITIIDSRPIEESKTPTVKVEARCGSCNNSFTYTSATSWGRKSGRILY